jgi:hypothetical protein
MKEAQIFCAPRDDHNLIFRQSGLNAVKVGSKTRPLTRSLVRRRSCDEGHCTIAWRGDIHLLSGPGLPRVTAIPALNVEGKLTAGEIIC